MPEAKCEALKFKLQDHEFEGKVRVWDLKGYDSILGMDRLSGFSPILIDWKKGKIQPGKDISLQV